MGMWNGNNWRRINNFSNFNYINSESVIRDHKFNNFKLIRTAFNQRRKTLENALKEKFDREGLLKAAAALKIDLKKRAETISLEQYAGLANLLAGN